MTVSTMETPDREAPPPPAPTPAIELKGRVQRLRRLMEIIEERSPDHVALTGARYRDPKVRGQFLYH